MNQLRRIISSGVRRHQYAALIAGSFILFLSLCAGPASAAMTAKAIAERISSQLQGISDYTVNAVVTVKATTMRIPETQVEIFFKKPDKVKIEGKNGFAMVPRDALFLGDPFKPVAEAPDLKLKGSERIEGTDCYILACTLTRDGRSVKTSLWVDKSRFLVRKMTAGQEWGTPAVVKFYYTKVGRFWLPAATILSMTTPPIQQFERGQKTEAKPQPMTVTVKCSGYRVNKGLSDKIFAQQQNPVQQRPK